MALRPIGQPRALRTRRKPSLEALETRELCTVLEFKATAFPQVLVPQNHRWVPILVKGTFTTSGDNETPTANYQVIDEYREYQTRTPIRIPVIATGTKSFAFSFVIHLRASVSRSATTNRQYYLVVAGQDTEGSNGAVLPIVVPPITVSARPHPVPPRALAFHRTR